MTINYLDSKRIQGLSADTKPTNVQTNSIFEQTDTNTRYWYDGSIWKRQILGTPDYISSNWTGNPSSYLTISNNSINFSGMPTNAHYYLYKSIPSVSPSSNFTLNFKFNASVANTYDSFFLFLRDVITNLYTGDGIGLQIQGGGYNRFTFNKIDNGTLTQSTSSNNTWVANTNYWCTIYGNGDGNVYFKIWTNSGRTGDPLFTLSRTITGLNNFIYMYHGGTNSGDSNIFSGVISEVEFYQT